MSCCDPKDRCDTPQKSEEIRERVRRRYAEAIGTASSCCGGSCGLPGEEDIIGGNYTREVLQNVPEGVQATSFGCGNPIEAAGIRPGETVLDLGCGAGLDAFLAAGETGPTGKVYGLDMTEEMLETARRNREAWGLENVEFLRGEMESIPLPDGSVDLVVSNCVLNLSPEKDRVFREIVRVLRPGGRMAVADVVALRPLPERARRSLSAWSGCLAGALSPEEFLRQMEAAGLRETRVEVRKAYGFSPSRTEELFPELSPEEREGIPGALGSGLIRGEKPRHA